jgi:AraC-like DNA-binding protein
MASTDRRVPAGSLPRVLKMGINRDAAIMPFAEHTVDAFALNYVTGGTARCRLDGADFVLRPHVAHLTRRPERVSCSAVDGVRLWRWVVFSWPGHGDPAVDLPGAPALGVADRTRYEAEFDALFEDFAAGEDGWELRASARLVRLIAIVHDAGGRLRRRTGDDGPGAGRARVAAAFIDRHAQRRLLLRDVAAAAGVNASYLTRVFRRYLGMPPMRYLVRARAREARRLLIEQPALPIRVVCARAGFADFGHFARVFRAHYQSTPREFRIRRLARSVR